MMCVCVCACVCVCLFVCVCSVCVRVRACVCMCDDSLRLIAAWKRKRAAELRLPLQGYGCLRACLWHSRVCWVCVSIVCACVRVCVCMRVFHRSFMFVYDQATPVVSGGASGGPGVPAAAVCVCVFVCVCGRLCVCVCVREEGGLDSAMCDALCVFVCVDGLQYSLGQFGWPILCCMFCCCSSHCAACALVLLAVCYVYL